MAGPKPFLFLLLFTQDVGTNEISGLIHVPEMYYALEPNHLQIVSPLIIKDFLFL